MGLVKKHFYVKEDICPFSLVGLVMQFNINKHAELKYIESEAHLPQAINLVSLE